MTSMHVMYGLPPSQIKNPGSAYDCTRLFLHKTPMLILLIRLIRNKNTTAINISLQSAQQRQYVF